MHYVFVYGTLKKDFYNHALIKDQEYLGHASTEYPIWQMYSLGAFPGVVPGENIITGELYLVDDDCLKDLDRLEGHPNFYTRVKVNISHEINEAWMYVYQGSVAGLEKVEGW